MPGVFAVLDPASWMAASHSQETQSAQTTRTVSAGGGPKYTFKVLLHHYYKIYTPIHYIECTMSIDKFDFLKESFAFRDSPSTCFCRGWPAM